MEANFKIWISAALTAGLLISCTSKTDRASTPGQGPAPEAFPNPTQFNPSNPTNAPVVTRDNQGNIQIKGAYDNSISSQYGVVLQERVRNVRLDLIDDEGNSIPHEVRITFDFDSNGLLSATAQIDIRAFNPRLAPVDSDTRSTSEFDSRSDDEIFPEYDHAPENNAVTFRASNIPYSFDSDAQSILIGNFVAAADEQSPGIANGVGSSRMGIVVGSVMKKKFLKLAKGFMSGTINNPSLKYLNQQGPEHQISRRGFRITGRILVKAISLIPSSVKYTGARPQSGVQPVGIESVTPAQWSTLSLIYDSPLLSPSRD